MLAGDVEPPDVSQADGHRGGGSFGYQARGVYGFNEELTTRRKRLSPDADYESAFIPGEQSNTAAPVLGKRHGNLPLPAPFVAGALVATLADQSGVEATTLRFVQSLKDNADQKSLREYRRRLDASSRFAGLSVRDDLLRDLRNRFELHRADSSTDDVLGTVKGKFQVFDGRGVFPRNEDAVVRICTAQRP